MIKIWGRNSSSNVQKAMWAVGELKLEHERIDVGGAFEPRDPKQRAIASQWMDWQLSVLGPAIGPAFWGLIRTPVEKRDMAAIKMSQEKTTDAMKMLDARLGKTEYVAGPSFSYGDIPVGIMCYRFVQLVQKRPPMPNL